MTVSAKVFILFIKKKCRKRLQEKNYIFKNLAVMSFFFSPLTKCRGINHFLFFFFLKITLSLLMSMLTFFSVFPDSDFLYTCHGFVKTFRAQHFPESFSTSEKKMMRTAFKFDHLLNTTMTKNKIIFFLAFTLKAFFFSFFFLSIFRNWRRMF